MLSFQKLDVYQRAIQFLVVALEVISRLPNGHAALAASCATRRSRRWRTLLREPDAAPGRMPAIITSLHGTRLRDASPLRIST